MSVFGAPGKNGRADGLREGIEHAVRKAEYRPAQECDFEPGDFPMRDGGGGLAGPCSRTFCSKNEGAGA